MSQFTTNASPGNTMIDAEPRTSIAAILGFVVSLIGCCLPTGLLGVALGVFGLVGISRSGGRVGGKGLAIAAIIIGILNTMIWIGAVAGALAIGREINVYGTQAGTFLTHLEAGNYDESRAMLTGPMANIDDASLKSFSDAVQSNLGSFVSTPDSLGSLWGGYLEMGTQLSQNQIPMSMPIPLQFENGKAMVQYVFDASASKNGINAMTDLQVIEADGTIHQLTNFVTLGTVPAPADPPADLPQDPLGDPAADGGP